MKTKKEVIICHTCKGFGIRYQEHLADYHKGTYITRSYDCKTCGNRGVLVRITQIEIRKLKDSEHKLCDTHNGKFEFRRGKEDG